MLCLCRSGLELDVDIVSSDEEQEKIEGVGEGGLESGRLKDRVNVELNGGVAGLDGVD